MAEDRMAVLETLRKAMAEGDVDFLREGIGVLAQAVMEAEVTQLTGVPHGERDPEHRLTNRNGYRERRWDTRVGTVELAIPRVRDGSSFPSLLEPRRRAERALLAVVQEAYVLGVSTRRVEDLVEALGIASLSKSEVSRMCAALDAEVEAFRGRPLTGERYPYLWLDATYVKVREAGRVVQAVEAQLLGAAWQRCRVHFTRNAQDLVPRSARGMIATVIRSIFEQPDEASARAQLRRVVDGLTGPFPAVAELLLAAEADLLVHFTFPESHRRQIRSTNPQERLNKELKRRTRVVGIFPTRASVIRLVGMVLAEQDDEWQDGRRYLRPETMAAIERAIEPEEVAPALMLAS